MGARRTRSSTATTPCDAQPANGPTGARGRAMARAATPGVRRPLRPAIAWVLGFAAGVLAVLTLGVFAIWFLVLAPLPAVVLVPAGLVYGLISVVVLTARRARARREDDLSAIPAAADAMRFELPIQKVDRMVHVALLLLAVFGGGSVL